jgi:hypothetical protein
MKRYDLLPRGGKICAFLYYGVCMRPGNCATPNGELSPLQAQLDLSLAPSCALPDAMVRIDVAGLREAGYEIPEVSRVSNAVTDGWGRVYTMPSGGYEMQFPYAILSEFLSLEGG